MIFPKCNNLIDGLLLKQIGLNLTSMKEMLSVSSKHNHPNLFGIRISIKPTEVINVFFERSR